jgi:hypothetical protein
MWKNPVGLGANRTRIGDVDMGETITLPRPPPKEKPESGQNLIRNNFTPFRNLAIPHSRPIPAGSTSVFSRFCIQYSKSCIPSVLFHLPFSIFHFPPMSYTGPALDVPRFFADLPPAAAVAGFTVESYGEAAGFPLLLLRRPSLLPDAPTLYLSSGTHGDEPAGPLALLELLRARFFADRFNWLIFPVINPGGLARKTRENPDGLDVNRDYRHGLTTEARQHLAALAREKSAGRGVYALCVCLHEDWESQGFYLYELNQTPQPLIGHAVLAAVEPICGVDRSPVIEGMDAHNGLITRAVADLADRPQYAEAMWLALQHTPHNLTLEAPSAQPLATRVAAHLAATRTALATWEKCA